MQAEIYLHLMISCFFLQMPSYKIIHLTASEFDVAASQDYIQSPTSGFNDNVTLQSSIFHLRSADLLSNGGRH